MSGSGVTIAEYVSSLSSATPAITDMFGDILHLFATEPVLVLAFAIFLVGAVIGLCKRLIN